MTRVVARMLTAATAAAVVAFPACTTTAFVLPGIPAVHLEREVGRPAAPSQPSDERYSRSRPPIVQPTVVCSSSSADDSDNATTNEDAVQQEINRIKEAHMTAGQIKTELDALRVSYVGLLEKTEYVRALAEARVAGGAGDSST